MDLLLKSLSESLSINNSDKVTIFENPNILNFNTKSINITTLYYVPSLTTDEPLSWRYQLTNMNMKNNIVIDDNLIVPELLSQLSTNLINTVSLLDYKIIKINEIIKDKDKAISMMKDLIENLGGSKELQKWINIDNNNTNKKKKGITTKNRRNYSTQPFNLDSFDINDTDNDDYDNREIYARLLNSLNINYNFRYDNPNIIMKFEDIFGLSSDKINEYKNNKEHTPLKSTNDTPEKEDDDSTTDNENDDDFGDQNLINHYTNNNDENDTSRKPNLRSSLSDVEMEIEGITSQFATMPSPTKEDNRYDSSSSPSNNNKRKRQIGKIRKIYPIPEPRLTNTNIVAKSSTDLGSPTKRFRTVSPTPTPDPETFPSNSQSINDTIKPKRKVGLLSNKRKVKTDPMSSPCKNTRLNDYKADLSEVKYLSNYQKQSSPTPSSTYSGADNIQQFSHQGPPLPFKSPNIEKKQIIGDERVRNNRDLLKKRQEMNKLRRQQRIKGFSYKR